MSARTIRPVSVVEAKARFSEVVREAEAGAIVMIRRHGRDVAAAAGGWRGSEDLVARLDAIRRSTPRRRARLGS